MGHPPPDVLLQAALDTGDDRELRAALVAEPVKVLHKALGFTVSVAVAATGDFGLFEELAAAATDDSDLRWVVRENLRKGRLQRWPDEVGRLRLLVG